MSNQHLIFACLVSFVVSNFPEPMLIMPSILLGVTCGVCGYILTKRDEQAEKIAQNHEQE